MSLPPLSLRLDLAASSSPRRHHHSLLLATKRNQTSKEDVVGVRHNFYRNFRNFRKIVLGRRLITDCFSTPHLWLPAACCISLIRFLSLHRNACLIRLVF
jgi:hypothetical protein